MNTTTYTKCIVIVSIFLALGVIPKTQATPTFTTQVELYQGLDIDTNLTAYDPRALVVNFGEHNGIDPVVPQVSFDLVPAVDVHFEFIAGGAGLPVMLFLDNNVHAAVLENTAMNTLDAETLAHIPLMSSDFGMAFNAHDTIVLMTTEGNYFALGGFAYHTADVTVRFTYQQLKTVPEASTLLLLSIGLVLVAALNNDRNEV